MLCVECHIRYDNSYEEKEKFLGTQLDRYGLEAIEEWLDECPDRYRISSDYQELRRMIDGD